MVDNSIQAQEAIALEKIKSIFHKAEGEYNTTLFVSHHLEGLSEDDWVTLFDDKKPTPEKLLEALILKDKWDSEGDCNIDTFDFSLTQNVTDYLVSVRFSKDGSIETISMES